MVQNPLHGVESSRARLLLGRVLGRIRYMELKDELGLADAGFPGFLNPLHGVESPRGG